MPKAASAMDLARVGKGKAGAAAKGAAAKGVAPGSNKKVKFCMYHLQGVCKYSSEECAFAHSMEDMERARRARKAAGAGGKSTPPTSSGDELSSDGELHKPIAGDARRHFVDSQASTLYQEFCAAGQPSKAGAWPKLVEPMFVETSQPGMRHKFNSAPSTYAGGLAMPHDLEQYLDYSLLAAHCARQHANFHKPAQNLDAGLAAARVLGHPGMQPAHPKGIPGPSLDGGYIDHRFASAHGFGRRTPGAAMPSFYTMPNPFVGLAEPKVTGAPAFNPPPGLDPSSALGA